MKTFPNTIRTYKQLDVDPFDLKLTDIKIEDIAHALSMKCRFGGHCPVFYSVAQHSVICSYYVSIKEQMAALLHDASEAYISDIPSPVKYRLPDYLALERLVMEKIADVFQFEYPLSDEAHSIDKTVLEWEWDHIMSNDRMGLLPRWFIPMSPEKAEGLFLSYYNKYKTLFNYENINKALGEGTHRPDTENKN